jgi:hypothetical protein
MNRRILSILGWIDRAVNRYLLFGRWETISARMGRNIKSDDPSLIPMLLCSILDRVDPGHCAKALHKNNKDKGP